MRLILLVSAFLFGAQLLAADACYYGAGKTICMTRIGASVSYRGGAPMKLTGELGVRFVDGTTERMRDALLRRYGLTVVASDPDWPVYVKVKVPQGVDGFRLSRMLVEGSVKWAQPIWYEKVTLLSTTPNDTFFPDMWHHTMVRSAEAWDIATGDPRVIIGILDSGVETRHPDLEANMGPGKSFVPSEPDVDPIMEKQLDATAYEYAHGTAVAGVAAACGNNGTGTVGVCWNCTIMPMKYVGHEIVVPTDRKLNAMKWATDNGAYTVNNSWKINTDKDESTGECLTIPYENYVNEAIEYGKTNGRGGRGTIMVWAVGNSACDTQFNENFNREDILLVAALRSNGDITDYSNYGYEVDLSAPSGFDSVDDNGLYTTDSSQAGKGYNPHFFNDLPDPSYTKFFNGTSGAAPVVTGALGLLLSKFPYFTAQEAIDCLKMSGVEGNPDTCFYGPPEKCYGEGGILDVAKTLQNARDGLCGGTPECTGPGDCGDEQECWNGICAEPVTVADDDVTSDDDTVTDDILINDQSTNDDVVTDQTVTDDTATADDQPVADDASTTDDASADTNGQNDTMIGTDDVVTGGGDSGCGCSLI